MWPKKCQKSDIFFYLDSEKGANIVVASPSQGDFDTSAAIVTTDRVGLEGYSNTDYAWDFNGTSAATPIAAGCVALILESKAALTRRDVQHILIRTAYKNDPTDADWSTNAAGFHINHKYGFGRINVQSAVQLARHWSNVPAAAMCQSSVSPNVAIPDNDAIGVESSVEIPQSFYVEHVEVVFTADDHPYWTDLQIELVSPAGTRSVLAEQLAIPYEPDTPQYAGWRFLSVRHWGELSQGTWRLVVKDLASGNTGTFKSWELQIYGTSRQVGIHHDGDCGATGIEFLLLMLGLMLVQHFRKK